MTNAEFEQGFRQSYYVWIRQWVLYACACVSNCCTYGSSWAAAPFMLIAHFGINYFLGSLEIHASARWLVGGGAPRLRLLAGLAGSRRWMAVLSSLLRVLSPAVVLVPAGRVLRGLCEHLAHFHHEPDEADTTARAGR